MSIVLWLDGWIKWVTDYWLWSRRCHASLKTSRLLPQTKRRIWRLSYKVGSLLKSRVQEYIKLTPFSDPVGLNVFFSTTKVRTIKRNIFLHKSRNISMSRFYLQSCLSKQANKVFYLYVSTWEHYHEKSILYKIELYHISSTTYYNHLLVYRV